MITKHLSTLPRRRASERGIDRATMQPTNCTQQVTLPGGRAAASIFGRFALFALEGHSTDLRAGHVDIFDIETSSWSAGQLSAARTNMCSTTWKHLAIFAGGTADRGQPKSNVVDVWDSTSREWSVHNLKIGRDLLACASAGNYTVFAGGSAPQANQSETASVEIWNHHTGEWTHHTLSQPRKKPEAVGVGQYVVIAGGEIAKPKPPPLSPSPKASSPPLAGYTATVDVFNTANGQWFTDQLISPRQYFGAAHVSGKAVGAGPGGVAIFGGGFLNGVRLGSVDIYDPASRRHTRAQLSHNRSNLKAYGIGHDR